MTSSAFKDEAPPKRTQTCKAQLRTPTPNLHRFDLFHPTPLSHPLLKHRPHHLHFSGVPATSPYCGCSNNPAIPGFFFKYTPTEAGSFSFQSRITISSVSRRKSAF